VGLPDEESRHAILQAKLENVPHSLAGHQLATLASQTAGYSGAGIEELVTDAKREAAGRDAREISFEDFPTSEDIGDNVGDVDPDVTTNVDARGNPSAGSSTEGAEDDSTLGFQ
jgi:SpoVK/Ycf46/Vps4 family AAA+-type ATPase